MNSWVITSYAFFTLALGISIFSMHFIPLSLSQIMNSTIYIFVTFLSVIILKEKLTAQKIAGIVLIIGGDYSFFNIIINIKTILLNKLQTPANYHLHISFFAIEIAYSYGLVIIIL